jgi:hypothetical protein
MRLRLKIATVATTWVDGKLTSTHLPKGSEITIIDEAAFGVPAVGNQQANVYCNGQLWSMFLVDLQERCEQSSRTALNLTVM